MAITKEQIWAAADELDASGQNPTLASVRKIVGGGSFTTISEAMNEWRSRKTAQAAPMREPAPQAVSDRLAELGADLWAVALEMANSRLMAEREALEAARLDMEAARQEAAELADQLTQELDETKSRLESIEAAEAAARGEAGDLRESLTAMKERATTAEARAAELRTELDHAHQEGRQMRGERDQAQGVALERAGLIEKLRDELATARTTVEQSERRAAELRLELDRAHQDADKARQALVEQRNQMAQEAARQAERYTKAQAERDAARRDAAQAREDAAALRGRLEALESLLPKGGEGSSKENT